MLENQTKLVQHLEKPKGLIDYRVYKSICIYRGLYLFLIAPNVYTPCTHFLRIQGIIISTNNERPGYTCIQSKLTVFPLASGICIWGRQREREWMGEWERKRANGERPIGQRQPAAASAWAWAVTRLNWPEAQRFRVVNHAPLRAESNCWIPAQHAKREKERATESDRERDAELAQLLGNFYVLRGLSCWSTSDTLNGFGKFRLISSLEIRASDASENYVCECYVRAIRGAIFTRVTRLPIPGKALCEKYLVANW